MTDPPAADRTPIWAAFCTALVLRCGLLALAPAVKFGDSLARLVEPHEVVKNLWLPGVQVVVSLMWSLFGDPLPIQAAMAVIGAVAAAGVAAVATDLAGREGGFLAGLFVAVHPVWVSVSVGVYQEPLTLALLTWATWLATREYWRPTVVLVAMATMVRYEAWFVAPMFAYALWAARRPWLALSTLTPAIAWVAYWAGPTPMGLQTARPPVDVIALLEHTKATARQSLFPAGWVLVALASRGLWTRRQNTVVLACAIFLTLDLLLLLGLHPHSGAVNIRQDLLLLAGLSVLAAAGISDLERSRWLTGATILLTSTGLLAITQQHRRGGHAEVRKLVYGIADGADSLYVSSEDFRAFPNAAAAECDAAKLYGASRGIAVRCDYEGGPVDADVAVRFGHFQSWRQPQATDWYGQGLTTRRQGDGWTLWARPEVPLPPTWEPTEFPCTGPAPIGLPFEQMQVGAGATNEGSRLFLYANSTIEVTAPSSGEVVLWACGVPASGVLPRLEWSMGELSGAILPNAQMRAHRLGTVRKGVAIRVRYANDAQDEATGEDRNVWIGGVEIR